MMISELDWFGHWFYGFLALGMLYLNQRDRWGWVFRIMGEVGWIWIGLLAGWSSIWMWGILFLLIDIRGFMKWREEDKLQDIYDLVYEQACWEQAGMNALEETEKKLDEAVISESERPQVAAKRSRTRKKNVRSTRGRRSVKADGKRRIRPNAKPKGTKRSRRNV